MERSTQFGNRFREVMLSGESIAGTNVKKELSQVTLKQAITKVGGLNTITALAYHINYYVAGVLGFFKNGELTIRDKYSFDLPELFSDKDWDRLKEELVQTAEEFAEHLEAMSEKKFNETFVKEEYGDVGRNVDGLIEHGYYHLGQIVLIRKLILQGMD